jgi:hypothetical protein
MITLITSLLVSFSNDELNRILQSDAIKNMAITASMSQSMISQSMIRGVAGATTGNRNRRGRKHDSDEEDSDRDYYDDDDDDDEVHMDRYDDEMLRSKRM